MTGSLKIGNDDDEDEDEDRGNVVFLTTGVEIVKSITFVFPSGMGSGSKGNTGGTNRLIGGPQGRKISWRVFDRYFH